jgi:hypothetical protein
MTRLEQIEQALGLLGQARQLLKAAKAPKALEATYHAMKSTEGARRHEFRLQFNREYAAQSQAPKVPRVQPMTSENPMYSLGYRWEVIDHRGFPIGGAETKAEAEQVLNRQLGEHVDRVISRGSK